MKKSVIIWTTAIILVAIAVYTTRSYNAKSNPVIIPPQEDQQTEQAAPAPSPEPSPAPTDSSQPEGQQEQKKINLMESYDFTLEDLSGNKITLSGLKGKKVYLNFWATWCPPCKAEMPDLEKLYQETKESGLVILAVNVGEDKKTVQDFITKNKYNFPVLLDTKGEISQQYQVTGIPTSYFIDTEGFLDDGATGAIPLESMKEFVNNLE
ncbi:MAG TPA: TlpA disulfide reductase family protein [Clostridia bacterium]|nr:TlpA disulfide reductase family protein [Clostridia bacterium]